MFKLKADNPIPPDEIFAVMGIRTSLMNADGFIIKNGTLIINVVIATVDKHLISGLVPNSRHINIRKNGNITSASSL